ncbi:amidohydrolase family protein [Nocardioides sp. SYSU D00065]|uniref:amidohydrolase family protein n=1 Tax=Nocardioides sp. SYSU D00065 TaxID=2817378 RepID=UPI001B343838|nr:amidohydrolase family protein [Nocardioides sp. SYSU D00065]
MYADHLVQPWYDRLRDALPVGPVLDVHTHVGDSDSVTATVEELQVALDAARARALVFPLSEPDSDYRAPNAACLDAAKRSEGRLDALVRVVPDEVDALEGLLDGGAKGIKLHVSSDDLDLADPRLAPVFSVAHERRLPVLVHAGPEVDSVRTDVLATCERWPDLRLVLAHCALSDLGHLHRRVSEVPNLFFDTSWWTPANLLALFRLVPPGRVLAASDLPYSTPVNALMSTGRCAWQAGLDPQQVASVLGGQATRIVEGLDPLDLGPAPAREAREVGPFLEVVSTNLLAALEAMQRGLEPEVPLTVARHACDVPADDPDADVLASVLRLLDLYEQHHEHLPRRNSFAPGWDLVSAAAVVARTPAAPLP